jgi:hypothetical protein
VYGDADVDIVAESRDAFYSNKDALTPRQRAAFDELHGTGSSSISSQSVHREVETALRLFFTSGDVTAANKCLKLAARSGRLEADIIPCLEYKAYRLDGGSQLPEYDSGICFYDRSGNRIINYPVQHYDKGVMKNSTTCGRFKPSVRIMKNMRNYLYAENRLATGLAPSYFVNCLLYNAPDDAFQGTYQQSIDRIITWFINLPDEQRPRLVCQNGMRPLIGTSADQWNEHSFLRFIAAVGRLWIDG